MLSIAAAYHFTMVKHLGDHPEQASVKRFRKKNTLIAGPSGSGKTYCVEVLGDLLQVPTLIIDATDSETLKKLFFGASALNYMGVKAPFRITRAMVQDEKYFDKLFAEWYEERARKIRCG